MTGRTKIRRWATAAAGLGPEKAETYPVWVTVTDSSEPKSQTATTRFGLVIT